MLPSQPRDCRYFANFICFFIATQGIHFDNFHKAKILCHGQLFHNLLSVQPPSYHHENLHSMKSGKDIIRRIERRKSVMSPLHLLGR
jgi:hypothetical protein